MPPNNDTRTEHHYPETCEHCGTSLKDNPLALLMEALRHQVIDIPLLAATIVEYLLHAVKCPTCRKVTRAKLPEDVTMSPFGPGLQATVALLTGRYRLSRHEAEGFLQDILGIKISLGSVCAIEQTVCYGDAVLCAAVIVVTGSTGGSRSQLFSFFFTTRSW